MQINSTQLAGLLAFIPAAFASALVSGRAPARARKGWTLLAAIYALLAMEVLAKTRHRIDRAIIGWLQAHALYPERRPVQAAVILVLVVLGLLAARFLVSRTPAGRLRVATGATIAVLTLFIVESVSLHAVDAWLYRPIGPVMLIGWLWLACGWTVTGAAASAIVAPPRR